MVEVAVEVAAVEMEVEKEMEKAKVIAVVVVVVVKDIKSVLLCYNLHESTNNNGSVTKKELLFWFHMHSLFGAVQSEFVCFCLYMLF